MLQDTPHTSRRNTDESHKEMVSTALGMLYKEFSQNASEADLNKVLLDAIGSKGTMAQWVEEVLLDPMMALYQTGKVVDAQMAEMTEGIIVRYLKSQRELIAVALRSDVDAIHYCIALQEDNFENRLKLLSFTSQYKDLPWAEKFPVYLQVVPRHLIGNIRHRQEVNFQA